MLPSVKMNVADLTTALQQSQINEPSTAVGGFLKFDFRSGDWLYGRDQEEVTGDTVIVNTQSIGHGWVLWSNGKASKHMVPFNHPLPAPMDASGDDTPAEGRVMQGAFMDDGAPAEDAVQFTFETNSYGGRKGVDTLLSAIKTKAMDGSKHLFPAVKLKSDSYLNKKHGSTIHNPVFEIVGWYDAEGKAENAKLEQDAAPQEADAEPEAPKRRRRRATA